MKLKPNSHSKCTHNVSTAVLIANHYQELVHQTTFYVYDEFKCILKNRLAKVKLILFSFSNQNGNCSKLLLSIAIELTHPRTKAYNIQTHNRTCTKMPTCFEHPLTSDSFHVALFTLRPIFGKRSCLIAPLHILYISPFLPTDFIDCMCVSRNSFSFYIAAFFSPLSVVSLLLFLLLLLLLLILFVCFFLLFLALFSIDLSIFISVSQSIQFNIEFSSFHLNLFDCHSGVFFVRLCCNSIFLRMWIYFCSIIMITRCCGSATVNVRSLRLPTSSLYHRCYNNRACRTHQ